MKARPLAFLFVGAAAVLALLLLQLSLTEIRRENEALRKEMRHIIAEARRIATYSTLHDVERKNASEIDLKCAAPPEHRLRAGCWLSGVRAPYMGPLPDTEHLEHALSQRGEDLELMRRYFVGRRGGTFLEMGALDGKRYSNTMFFERALDWRGLLIEGSPDSFTDLVRNRPLAMCVHAMVCSEARQLHWVDRGSGPVRGAWELMTPQFRKKWHPTLSDVDVQEMPTVPCLRLSAILAKFDVRHVDLFSLDVEGAEESVLETIDFRTFSASVILLEVRQGQKAGEQLLLDAGYLQDQSIHNNAVFVHPRFKRSITDIQGNPMN